MKARPALPYLALLVLILAAAGWIGFGDLWTTDSSSLPRSETAFRAEVFAEGLGVPWGLAFLPDGRLLVTEREGTLRIVGTDGAVSAPVGGVPAVWAKGQGGLLDVALHPDYATNGWIYLTYSDPHPREDAAFTALMRARLGGDRLVAQEVLYRAPYDVYSSRGQHFGSRIAFDGAGHVYFSIGDRGQQEDAQRLGVPNGKIHRLRDDGSVPSDNPFAGRPGAAGSIWSYGHRNPQGLVRDASTGALWSTEHGPRGGDELNLVLRGRNYGWPEITFGINYNGTKITDETAREGMEQPVTHWTPSIAVSAVEVYDGAAFPAWTGSLFAGALKFQELRRLVVEDGRVVRQEVVYEPGARVRDIETGPDGALYLALEDPGRIVRLLPE